MKPIEKIRISQQSFEESVEKLTESLHQHFFSNNSHITGDEIENFSDFDQINNFIIFQIFQAWEHQMSQLKSPYFDYAHPEVKQSLSGLHNILSQHILIDSKHFKTLLQSATYNSLRLLLDPELALKKFFFIHSDTVELNLIKKYAAYFTELDFVLANVIGYYDKEQKERVLFSEFIKICRKIVALYEKREGFSFVDERKMRYENITASKIETTTSNVKSDFQSKMEFPTNTPKIENEEQKSEPKNLNEQFSKKPALNETLGKNKLAFEKLSIVQKQQFVKKIFNGEVAEYEKAVNYAKQISSESELNQFLDEFIFVQPNIDENDPTLLKFIEAIYNNFR